ncbi:hypothetical protein TRFO_33776 [Tritrichomonas foetus]|uniref:Initiator binding domain-containing protein n=1 Tax=Tritrichomonas foetus TaxID=1144522 RepID=A0A1J4JMT3_9EUKA|nr:hypothetical protein TRFO_33776 [Tritrichomonas foetus]|eukprot:OHS99743.1 hypothetical protein TRFO_33776 [Tritrichomonas foetus]
MTQHGSHQNQSAPKYWWLLSEPDRVAYTYIRTYIKNNPESNQRNKRLSAFTDMLDVIRRYAVRGDSGDANRCLVCGILWLPGAIAINTHQLGFLMAKCKSSINGSLQILGYKEKIMRKTASDLVANTLIAIRDDRSELRKWTVRCQDDSILELPNLMNNEVSTGNSSENDQKDINEASENEKSAKNSNNKSSNKKEEKIQEDEDEYDLFDDQIDFEITSQNHFPENSSIINNSVPNITNNLANSLNNNRANNLNPNLTTNLSSTMTQLSLNNDSTVSTQNNHPQLNQLDHLQQMQQILQIQQIHQLQQYQQTQQMLQNHNQLHQQLQQIQQSQPMQSQIMQFMNCQQIQTLPQNPTIQQEQAMQKVQQLQQQLQIMKQLQEYQQVQQQQAQQQQVQQQQVQQQQNQDVFSNDINLQQKPHLSGIPEQFEFVQKAQKDQMIHTQQDQVAIQQQNDILSAHEDSIQSMLHPFDNELFDFPLPPKKSEFEKNIEFPKNLGMDNIEPSKPEGLDFTKEDAILNMALSGYNEKFSDIANDFWNIEIMNSDSFFL